MVRETRHLWVGNLPENVRDDKIIEHFKRYGRVESVKILPKRGSDGGVAAFVDFVDIKSAQKAHNAVNKMGDRDLRTDYNEPGTIPGAARVLDETVSITSRSREVSGFRGGGGGPAYGPPQSLHAREGRYERRLDGILIPMAGILWMRKGGVFLQLAGCVYGDFMWKYGGRFTWIILAVVSCRCGSILGVILTLPTYLPTYLWSVNVGCYDGPGTRTVDCTFT